MKHSIVNRVIIAKVIGFVAGLLCVFIMPMMGSTLGIHFSIGIVLFMILMGALVGFMGIVDRHPIFKFKMPFWLRGIVVGAFMYLILILLSYDQIAVMLSQMDFMGMEFKSPYWSLIDGAILGLIMEWAATKYAGEGSNLPLK